VKRWTGSTWQQIGGVFDTGATSPTLALDTSNNPVIALIGTSMYVKGYFKNAFKPFANSLDKVPSLESIDSSIALDNKNRPVVTWSEGVSGTSLASINVSHWVGNAWSSLPEVNDGFLERGKKPAIAVEKSTTASAFNPVVAWAEEFGVLTGTLHYNIYVKRWNGAAWVEYLTNTPLDRTVTNDTTEPALALDSSNKPYVAWVEVVNGSRNIYVKRWTGTAWAWVGTSAAL
jgi:hypothetical protein